MTAAPQPNKEQPTHDIDGHDTAFVYVHREPGPLRRAAPWVLLAVIVAAFIALGYYLAKDMAGRPASFTIYKIGNGWLYFLGFLVVASGVLALTSFIGQRIGIQRTGRKIKYGDVLGVQLTHLFLMLVVLIAIYPLFYVVLAAFDPKNSLYAFPNFDAPTVLGKSGILPSFKGLNTENFAKLFDGVQIPAWELVLAALAGAAIAVLIFTAVVRRIRGLSENGTTPTQSWAARILVVSLIVLVLFIGPAQFTGAGTESKFLLSVRNTLLVSGVTGALAILLSTTAGYAMARLRFPGRFQTLLFFIFVQMFPVFLGLVAVYALMYGLGLLNSFTGLILAYSGGAIAFNTWIYKGYVESLPESLEEAAMVDGATRWGAFTRVVLPLSGSMLVFIFLNQFIGTYAEFILANVLLTGVEQWTIGLLLKNFTSGQFNTKWGIFAAAATLGSLPIVALFYGFQGYFVGGTTAGGVKE
ncbi:sugar ABC transporter permease (plasmid) [Deinococcus psychrotolerans]|uniref:Sugar ABC transporter permease n=1 Tax=Deinococcus psychrotolerans TaxID=2489213 RepID=A0A3G8YIB4_9DEIO|nr:sugar ABC transporter permease [Deinococcus psychrotolerans]AZI44580.1 sugar ABC transporter permease [Deinococcus psychrotolerans]